MQHELSNILIYTNYPPFHFFLDQTVDLSFFQTKWEREDHFVAYNNFIMYIVECIFKKFGCELSKEAVIGATAVVVAVPGTYLLLHRRKLPRGAT